MCYKFAFWLLKRELKRCLDNLCVVLRNLHLSVKESVLSLVTGRPSCLPQFWVWSLGTKGIHYCAKENSNEINFILNHIWIWRGWGHPGFRCSAADLYCCGSLTALPSRILYKFFVPTQIHYWNTLLCSLTWSQMCFNTSWSYRCIYVTIWIQHHVFSIVLTLCSSPPRRCQRVSEAGQEGSVDLCSLFKEADPPSCWGQSSAFFDLYFL